MRDHLAVLYRREVDDLPHRCWCPQWWRHAEAVARLEALWRSFEHLCKDPHTGMSVWLRDHADHHMEKLYASDDTRRLSPVVDFGPDCGCLRPS